MTDTDQRLDEEQAWRSFLWERPPGIAGPNPAALAALRRGAGREPGSVPEMWPYHRYLSGDYRPDARTTAEHHALVLYGFHQQSTPLNKPVHQENARFGAAVAALRERFSPAAVDARFFRAVTATDLGEVAHHLRGLVMQLKSLSPVPSIDYTQLVRDLTDWQYPDRIDAVRRRWGSQYPDRTRSPGTTTTAN